MNLDTKLIRKNIPKKLNLQNMRGGNRETYGDYYLDGKFEFRVTMPNIHGGSGKTPSPGLLKNCRSTIFLSTEQYARLVRCPMDGEEYEEIIRMKIKEGKII